MQGNEQFDIDEPKVTVETKLVAEMIALVGFAPKDSWDDYRYQEALRATISLLKRRMRLSTETLCDKVPIHFLSNNLELFLQHLTAQYCMRFDSAFVMEASLRRIAEKVLPRFTYPDIEKASDAIASKVIEIVDEYLRTLKTVNVEDRKEVGYDGPEEPVQRN